MSLELFQRLFQKSWQKIDQKKCLLVFFSLCICGLLVVFSRVVTLNSGMWLNLSLSFAPIFLIGGLLFALGIVLIRTYQKEKGDEKVSYLKVTVGSWKAVATVAYITLPMLLLSLISWLVLGFFFLLKEIPGIGEFVGVFLSFAPFILILSALVLVFLNVLLLFFLTPELSQNDTLNFKVLKNIYNRIAQDPLMSFVGLMVAILPAAFVLLFLVSAAFLTQKSYLTSSTPILISLQWFFLMLPFNALLTPSIIFFFNFSDECYQNANKSVKQSVSVKS